MHAFLSLYIPVFLFRTEPTAGRKLKIYLSLIHQVGDEPCCRTYVSTIFGLLHIASQATFEEWHTWSSIGKHHRHVFPQNVIICDASYI